MVQLDGGGGGGGSFGQELGGDPAGDADRTEISDSDGGLDGSDTATTEEDDTGDAAERQLRPDATSDPMADQTEPAPSPTGTTATVDSGSEPAPAPEPESEPSTSSDSSGSDDGGSSAPSPSGTSATVSTGGSSTTSGSGTSGGSTDGGGTVDVEEPSEPAVEPPDSGGQAPTSDNSESEPPNTSDITGDTGDTTTGAGTSGPSDTASSTGSGGDGDTKTVTVIEPDGSQTMMQVDADRDIASTVQRTESGELIGASAPGQAPGETRAPSAGAGSGSDETLVATGTVSGQGIETGGPGSGGNFQATLDGETVSGSKQDIATAIESSFLEDNPEFDESDVRVVSSDGNLSLEFTEEGAEQATELAMADALNRRAAEGNAIDVGTAERVAEEGAEAEQQAEIQLQEALEGVGFFDEQAEQQQALREQVEQDIEGQVGAARAERAGIVNPTLRENVVGNTDLDPGEDFTIDFNRRETEDGVAIQIDANLTEDFRREEAERAFERALFEETGVRLQPDEGFRAIQGDEGRFEAEITETGQQRIREEQPEQFGDIDWSFGLGDPETDEVEEALGDASAAISGAGRDFASALFDEGGVASESLGEEILIAAGREDLGRQYEEQLRSFGKGVGQAPFLLADVPALAKLGLETVEYSGYATQQDVPTTLEETEERAVDIGEAVYGEVTARPAEFAGIAVGTLAGSYGIINAASSIGRRAGLVARYAIQPGEELAGSAGFRATRILSNERRAQQLFPNRELLIFSEEAAIRTARRLRSRIDVDVSAARSRALDIALGEPETRLVREGSSEIDGFEESRLVTDRPGPLSQVRSGLASLEDAFTGRAYAGVPVPRRAELETKSASAEAETESLLDELKGPLSRMESAQKNRVDEARKSIKDRHDVKENPWRSGARRRGSGIESELTSETDSFRRLEIAGQPTTAGIESELSTEVTGGQMLRQDTLGLQSELGRSDLLMDTRTETEARLDQELLQELELETETETESRLELDLETDTFLESEFALELETEVESELEFEFETETEVEVEPFGQRTDTREEDAPGGLFGESRTVLERDLLNPFTGR